MFIGANWQRISRMWNNYPKTSTS